MNGYKALGSLLAWMVGTGVIAACLTASLKREVTKFDVLFHVCWNLTVWFAYQLGELRREIRERCPR